MERQGRLAPVADLYVGRASYGNGNDNSEGSVICALWVIWGRCALYHLHFRFRCSGASQADRRGGEASPLEEGLHQDLALYVWRYCVVFPRGGYTEGLAH